MPTSSTVPTVKAALVSLLDAQLDVPVFYEWSPDAEGDMVFLGRKPGENNDGVSYSSLIEHDIATMKAGRKSRQESYTVELTVWSYRGDLGPSDSATAEVYAFELLEAVEDVLADDPKLGLTNVIQWARVAQIEQENRPLDAGWRISFLVTLAVNARLT